MADTKISALTALTGANVDTAADVLPIVDTSVTTTKKILIDELRIAIGIATQAQQETGTSNVVFVTPGRQQYHPSAIKGHCLADTGGGGDAFYNITSISDTGTGKMTVTWGTDFSGSTKYVVSAVCVSASNLFASVNTNFDAGTTEVWSRASDTGAFTDPNYYMVMAAGDQA